ncbi:MAG: hypothetical protein AAGG11_10510 [Pseudomonadota bacterium]
MRWWFVLGTGRGGIQIDDGSTFLTQAAQDDGQDDGKESRAAFAV